MDETNTFKRSRRQLMARGRSRGAAMVEALVVIPFFMLILAGALYVAGLYSTRIEVQGVARTGAWNGAIAGNCQGVPTVNDLADFAVVDKADLGELSSSPLAALCDADFGAGVSRWRKGYEVTGPFPFPEAVIETVAMMPCNDEPIAGDTAYENAVKYLWDLYQSQGTIPPDADPATTWPIIDIFSPWLGVPYL
jgi:hypothetical protein